MKYVLLGLFLLIALTAAVVLGFYAWTFRHSPAYLWRARLRRRIEELQGQLQLPDRPTDMQTKGAKLGETLFQTHLQSIPCSAVIGFPGIGQGTADRLIGAGRTTLASLVGYDFERIPGVGPVKAAEVKAAVRQLWSDAKARFESGGCLEGREFQKLWAEMAAADWAEKQSRTRRNAAIERTLDAMRPLLQLSDDVTYWNHLFHGGQVPGLTDEVMDRPLPEVVVEAVPVPVVHVAKPVAPPMRESPTPALAAKAVSRPAAPPDLFRQALQAPPSSPASEHPLLPKLRAYCTFALVVAKADGKIAKSERKEVRELLASTFGHDLALVRFIDPVMEQIEKAVPPENVALADILKLTTADERRMLYTVAERIADAAGERGTREVEALRRIAAALEVTLAGRASDGVRPEIRDVPPISTQPSLARPANEPRLILEIEPAAQLSPELIRRRFLLLTERADPAKAAALGPEFAAMAEAKRADIRRAALQLMEPFGEPLEAPAAPPPPSDIRHNPDLDDVFGA